MIKGNIILFIFIGIILGITSILYSQKQNYNLIPKKIWTYWDNPDSPHKPLPKSVKLCIKSWKKFNPNYEIILLTRNNFKGYVTIPLNIQTHPHFNDSPQRFADLIRLYVLEEHGGIWLDATVLVKQPFDKWLFYRPAEFAGYYMEAYSNKNTPVIENWFLAANKNSEFIKRWKSEFLEIANFKDIQEYLNSRKKMGVNYGRLRDAHYLAAYVASLKVIEIDKYPLSNLILRKSEEGPFKYLDKANWYPDKALTFACFNKSYQTPMMKMRQDERDIMDKKLDSELSCDVCGWLD